MHSRMQRRRLGRSELELPAVVLGAWAIGGWNWGGSDEDEAVRAIHAALEAGSDAIDTAPVYGFGRSERVVGRALRERAGGAGAARVLTKVGLRWDDPRGELSFRTQDVDGRTLEVRRNARPDSVRHEVEQSLARLGLERLDLVQVHWPDPTTPIADTMGALLELRREGKLDAIGVSNYTPAQMEEAQRALGEVPLASDQPQYSLLVRGIERDVLPWAREHEVGLIVYSPLEQGLLSGAVGPERVFPPGDGRAKRWSFTPTNRARVAATLERVARPLAARHGATLSQLAIAWVCAQPGVTSAIVGARTPAQARENAAAGALRLAPEELRALGEAFAALELERPRGGPLRRLARSARRLLRGG